MKVLSVIAALALFSSVLGVAGAFEVEEIPHQMGEVWGVPCGCSLCFLSLPCDILLVCPPALCALMCGHQYIIRDLLALFVSTVMRYVSIYLIPTVYDLVDTVSPLPPDTALGYISGVLSLFKGFFDGAWMLGRFSLCRFCLSPVGKVINGLLTGMSMEGYYKRAELIEKGIPVREID